MRPRVYFEVTNLLVAFEDVLALNIHCLDTNGNVIALVGHNGAGKSTFIKTMLGLLEPRRGQTRLLGAQGESLAPERDMAFCPETGSVFADITVEQYVRVWCRIKQRDAAYYHTAGATYVERLQIGPLLPKRGRELSKGQRRRVQTALGFMSDPKVYLFDEPFDGLDVQRTHDLMEIVEEESARRCFVISSHRMDIVERIADTIIVLRDGDVACHGPLPNVCAALMGREPPAHDVSLTDAMHHHLQALRG